MDLSADARQAISPFEQKVCRLFASVELKGKKGRTVPILVPQTVRDAILKLINYRRPAGVSDDIC